MFLKVFSFLLSPTRGKATPRDVLQYWQGEAIVEREIHPRYGGRVRFRGSFWSARCIEGIKVAPGEVVRVVGRQSLTLLVQSSPS